MKNKRLFSAGRLLVRAVALSAAVVLWLTGGWTLASSVTSSLPINFTPSTPFAVTNTVIPDPVVSVYAVEDTPPAGWAVSGVSGSGTFDASTHTVQWGPFFDALPRTLSYVVTPPATAAGSYTFIGDAVFDLAATVTITGQRSSSAAVSATNGVFRLLPAAFVPGTPSV